MTRLAQLSLLVVWLLGAVLAGVTVAPAHQTPPPQLVLRTDVALLTMDDDQVALTVGLSGYPRWRIAAPLPSFLVNSHQGCPGPQSAPPQETANRPEAPRESATFIPL